MLMTTMMAMLMPNGGVKSDDAGNDGHDDDKMRGGVKEKGDEDEGQYRWLR